MKKILPSFPAVLLGAALSTLSLLPLSVAAKTAAGTPIKNQATLNFSMGASGAQQTQSNESTFLVQEVIDVVAVWSDTVNVQTASPDTEKVLSFLVTNTGNGPQKYAITYDSQLTGDDFNPIVRSTGTIYVESGGVTGLQLTGPSADTPYGGSLDLNPGQSKVVFLVFDIPNGLQPTNKGFVDLKVISSTPGVNDATATGYIIPGAGQGGVDIVVGPTKGRARPRGIYEVNQSIVNITKNVIAVLDPSGGTQPLPQAVLTYEVVVESKGTGAINEINFEDAIPTTVDYVPGSIKLNGVAKTDAADGDEATLTNNTIYMKLGNTTSGTVFKIQYQTKIK